jgi:uncharacterized protein YeaO (DUF488 family)
MPNHVHLVIRTKHANLARGMQRLHGMYAQLFISRPTRREQYHNRPQPETLRDRTSYLPHDLSSSPGFSGDTWVGDVAPSPGLRTWFGHDPSRFAEFAERYRAELEARPEVLEPILAAARRGPVTLLYAAGDTEHNHAVVLRDHLEALLSSSDSRSASPSSGSN